MTYYEIYNNRRDEWLESFSWNAKTHEAKTEWKPGRAGWPLALSFPRVAAIVNLLGEHDLVIVPMARKTNQWFKHGNVQPSRQYSDEEREWLEAHLRPLWNGVGNYCWFVGVDSQTHGPIRQHEFGGYTIPGSSDLYESVFEAAYQMCGDLIKLCDTPRS